MEFVVPLNIKGLGIWTTCIATIHYCILILKQNNNFQLSTPGSLELTRCVNTGSWLLQDGALKAENMNLLVKQIMGQWPEAMSNDSWASGLESILGLKKPISVPGR